MATPKDKAVLNTILNPLMPNSIIDENENELLAESNTPFVFPIDLDYSDLPNIDECRRLESLGVRAAETKDYPNALTKFTEAIEICPNNPSPYNNRAQAYRLMENVDGIVFTGSMFRISKI